MKKEIVIQKLEIFKDIPGYEGLYQVSNLGRVYSLPKEWETGLGILTSHNGKILKQSVNNSGYFHIVLYNEGKQKTKSIHQLVAMAFLGYTPDGTTKIVTDHIDNNPLNNRLSNLQLISNRHNVSKDRKGSSKYTGVSWHKASNKWKSRIEVNGKVKYLGIFKCELAASAAYQKALSKVENNIEIEVKEVVFSSKYKGVNWDKNRNKWKSQITINGKQKYLGLFKCELEAHHAYQKALLKVEL